MYWTAEITLEKWVQGKKKGKIMYQKFSLLGLQLVFFCGPKIPYTLDRYLIIKKHLPQSQPDSNIGKKEDASGASQKLQMWTL